MAKNELLSLGFNVGCAEIGVPFQRSPAFVKREHCNLMDLIAEFEQVACGF